MSQKIKGEVFKPLPYSIDFQLLAINWTLQVQNLTASLTGRYS